MIFFVISANYQNFKTKAVFIVRNEIEIANFSTRFKIACGAHVCDRRNFLSVVVFTDSVDNSVDTFLFVLLNRQFELCAFANAHTALVFNQMLLNISNSIK